MTRDSARQEMPDQLRRDVRLLGEMLGTVLARVAVKTCLTMWNDSAAPSSELARGRSRAKRSPSSSPRGHWNAPSRWRVPSPSTSTWSTWLKSTTVCALRERDDAATPQRESLAAAVHSIREDAGPERLRELIAGMEFHPVLTAHPTEARRRAVSTAIQRISAQLERLHAAHPGSGAEAEARRRLLEEIDLLWRTSQLRYTKMDPLDEVRTAMAAFDETIFTVIPEVYRSLDRALDPEGCGRRPALAKASSATAVGSAVTATATPSSPTK